MERRHVLSLITELWNARSAAIVVGTIAAVIAFLLVTHHLRRRREHEWKKLARRLRLRFTHADDEPRVFGTWQGRTVEVRVASESSDAEGAIVVTVLAVQLKAAPENMTAEGAPGLVGDLANLSEDHLLMGDESFDQNVHLTGEDESMIRDYWTAERRRVFLSLVERDTYDRLSLSEGTLSLEIRRFLADANELQRNLELLVETADQLEHSGTGTRDGAAS